MSEPLLQLEKVDFGYGQDIVLKNVSLRVNAGEIVCLLGESGSGKTTLFRLIQGEYLPTQGKIHKQGISTAEIAVVSQNYAVFPHLTVLQNIALVLRRRQPFWDRVRSDNRLQQLARDYLQRVNMDEFADYFPHTLSGGQRQRVALAQALAQQTNLILMDEPLGALDFKIREELQSLLLNLQKQYQVSILFITHDLSEALYLGERIYTLGSCICG